MLPELAKAFLLGFCAFALIGCAMSAKYHIYWGEAHGHTRISDGKGTLDDYFTYARDVAKLDFAIVSDHDFGNAHPWWMPPVGRIGERDAASHDSASHDSA
jgi:hypothetical protein